MVPLTFKSKIVYKRGQRVKFLKSGKYEYDFQKGDYGIIERVISPFPSATDTIYLVIPEKSGELMWVTGMDIVAFDQITLVDEEVHIKSKQKVLCDACYYEDLIQCIRPYNHSGLHEAKGGLTWLVPCPPIDLRGALEAAQRGALEAAQFYRPGEEIPIQGYPNFYA